MATAEELSTLHDTFVSLQNLSGFHNLLLFELDKTMHIKSTSNTFGFISGIDNNSTHIQIRMYLGKTNSSTPSTVGLTLHFDAISANPWHEADGEQQISYGTQDQRLANILLYDSTKDVNYYTIIDIIKEPNIYENGQSAWGRWTVYQRRQTDAATGTGGSVTTYTLNKYAQNITAISLTNSLTGARDNVAITILDNGISDDDYYSYVQEQEQDIPQ